MDSLHSAQRIIIKIGSSLMVNEAGRMNRYWLSGLIKDIAELRASGKEICVVSSGAVALGRAELGLPHGTLTQPLKQAAAACGQIMLMRLWQEVCAEDNITVAQILLTIDDSESRRRFLNARTTLSTLLECGALPIINENDTVATGELRVGDNDRLSARVAQMVGADLLILFSDVEGIYTANPTTHPDATFIPVIDHITDTLRGYAAPPTSSVGTGGMITKVEAAQIAIASGCHTVIALGKTHRPINALLHGARHSLFVAHTTPMSARKEWIAGSLSPSGSITIDAGAARALQAGGSLLPVGITAVSGRFNRADAVALYTAGTEKPLAKGLVAYDSEELQKIIGTRSHLIVEKLGYERGDNVIHRDNLVMM
jgi:glutamate 5-kinase